MLIRQNRPMAGYLSTSDVATLLGIQPSTVRFLRAESKPGHRYAADPFPEPDIVVARSPAWSEDRKDEILAWNRRRPGQGAGGGPRRERS
jgi:hypothetical protein